MVAPDTQERTRAVRSQLCSPVAVGLRVATTVALKLPPAVDQAVPGWRSVQLAAPAVPLPLPSTQLSVS